MKKDCADISVALSTVFLIYWLVLSALAQGNELSVEAAAGSGDNADLAQELTNPVADLISVPIQTNFDFNFGPADDGQRVQTNIQPVIPFSLNKDWNLITRTITPVIHQEDLFPGAGSQFGLGDINQTFFLSPKQPTANVVTWGAGPVFLFPTATDPLLGGEKWAAGPSVVVLRLQDAWTYGILANHIWSYAGESTRADINNTFLQPFVAYTTPDAWTYSLQSEASYNWTAEQWSIPINGSISKLVKIGKLPVSLQAGLGYWAESPVTGPEGFRFRLQANLVLPK
ncbi:MAG: transporter [Verrucomicrobiae bacterium]|nr:transporter [Verrucomicrobiae bacterium]